MRAPAAAAADAPHRVFFISGLRHLHAHHTRLLHAHHSRLLHAHTHAHWLLLHAHTHSHRLLLHAHAHVHSLHLAWKVWKTWRSWHHQELLWWFRCCLNNDGWRRLLQDLRLSCPGLCFLLLKLHHKLSLHLGVLLLLSARYVLKFFPSLSLYDRFYTLYVRLWAVWIKSLVLLLRILCHQLI